MPELQPQDIERVMHGNEDLMQLPHFGDRKEHSPFNWDSFEPEDIARGIPIPALDDFYIEGLVPTGTSTPDIARPLVRPPLSGSTGSGDGSRDGSMRDGDSDDAPTLSGRVTGLRSARQRPKRLTPDEMDDFSDEGGSPNGKNKRVQANRLSAQRSRQRKLQKEADLRQEVDELSREIDTYMAQERRLQALEQELNSQLQERENSNHLQNEIACLKMKIGETQAVCEEIMCKYPHLAQKEYTCR